MLDNHLTLTLPFHKICWLSERLGSALVHWDTKQQRLVPASDFAKLAKNHKIKCRIYLLCILLMASGPIFAKITKQETHNFRWSDYMLFGLLLGTNFACYLCLVSFRTTTTATCLFVNGLLNLTRGVTNSSVAKAKLESTSKYSLCAAYLFFWSIIGLPFVLIFGLHFLNPCKPAIAGYWLIPECNTAIIGTSEWCWTVVTLAVKCTSLLTNYFMFAFGMNFWSIAGCGLLILGSDSLKQCIKM